MNTRSRTRSGGAAPPAPIAIKKKTSTNVGARSKAKAAVVDKAAVTAASASSPDEGKTVAVSEDAVAASKGKADAAAAKKAEAGAKKTDAAAAKLAEAAAKKADSAAAKKAEKKAPATAAAAAAPENGAGASAAGATKKSGLSVGDDFPAMKLLADDCKEVDLGAVLQERGLVLFMYPKANTPGCTKQACGFRENTAELAAAGFAVYGMSADTPTAQTSWKTKHSLAYPLLCDRDLTLVKAIGAFKPPKNIKRSHVVVAKGGKVLDVRVMIGPEDSFKEAVKFVKGLNKAE